MKKKTGKFIAVLSAFMMVGGGSVICGSIPVMAAETTTVNATANMTAEELAVLQAQLQAQAAVADQVQAAAAAGTTADSVTAATAGSPEEAADSADAASDPATNTADAAGSTAQASTAASSGTAVTADSSTAVSAAGTSAAAAAAGTTAAGVADSVSGLAAAAAQVQVTEEAVHVSAPDNGWTGPVLTRSKGVNKGPSGKETYYNLNMSRVIATMHRLGYEGEYWVRGDGVKMFGQYIMVAADLKKHPRGSLIETSLGTGIVVDTGEFPRYGVAVDIAVTW